MIKFSPAVIQAAQAAAKLTLVPASISLAQYGLESAWGTKVTGTFNYFGIKAVPGQSFTSCLTHEYLNGLIKPVEQNFANYSSVNDAFIAHSKLLSTNPRYSKFMGLTNINDKCNALTGVYATDPLYGNTLIEIIKDGKLTQYDEEN